MPWIPEEHMADVHIIRQDYALAVKAWQESPTAEHLDALNEQHQRRARAIRMVHNEDGASARHLSGMFRCSKTVIREAIQEGEQ